MTEIVATYVVDEIRLNASKIVINAKDHTYVWGKMGVHIESSGGDVRAKAESEVNLKSAGEVIIKGDMVKINE